MNKRLTSIKDRLYEGHSQEVIELLDRLLTEEGGKADPAFEAEIYYLRGNACRKQGDWQGALNSYQEAVARNPQSPAASARNMVLDILNFYNKDMFNQ